MHKQCSNFEGCVRHALVARRTVCCHLRCLSTCVCGKRHKQVPSPECFRHALEEKCTSMIQSESISNMHLWSTHKLSRLERRACGEYTSFPVSCVSSMRLWFTQGLPCRACSKHGLVVNTQAFPSRECFKRALVVFTQGLPCRACACGEYTSFPVSRDALVVNTQAFLSRVFQACACGLYRFPVSSMRSWYPGMGPWEQIQESMLIGALKSLVRQHAQSLCIGSNAASPGRDTNPGHHIWAPTQEPCTQCFKHTTLKQMCVRSCTSPGRDTNPGRQCTRCTVHRVHRVPECTESMLSMQSSKNIRAM